MGKKKKNKKSIPEPTIPNNEVPKQPLLIDKYNNFSFSSVYSNWIKGTKEFYKSYNFTNMVWDSEEFSRNITEIATEIIPKLFNEWENLLNNNPHNYHCHPVTKDKKELIRRISEKIHGRTFDEDELNQARIQWYYIGFKGNLRLIGLFSRDRKTFYPIFIDHHHLIYPDENYNQNDYNNYNFCPIDNMKA